MFLCLLLVNNVNVSLFTVSEQCEMFLCLLLVNSVNVSLFTVSEQCECFFVFC